MEFIGEYAEKGDRVLDFGCGNGRILEILGGKNIDYVGVDISENLIKLAEKKRLSEKGFRNIRFLKIDHGFKRLPFPDESFDVICAIAVFHHIPGEKERIEKARELYRLLKPGGKLVVSVWDLWQKRYIGGIIRNWKDKILKKSELDWNDCFVGFKNNEEQSFVRYHHAFFEGEMRKLFKKAGFSIKRSGKAGGNIFIAGIKGSHKPVD